MNSVTVIGITSIVAGALCMALGSIAPALCEARAIVQALSSIAQQPDEAGTISRTLFIGLAMIESLAIYVLVIVLIILFRNPLLEYIVGKYRV